MTEEMYVNKKGWRCVKSQLLKTDYHDPITWEKIDGNTLMPVKPVQKANKADYVSESGKYDPKV